MSRPRRPLVIAGVVFLALSATVAVFATQPGSPTATPDRQTTTTIPDSPGAATGSDWQRVFQDQFNGPTLDATHWSTCYQWSCTNAGNDELEWFVPEQVAVGKDGLMLSAQPQETNGKPYASGMISSYGKFTFTYGYVQIIAKMPNGAGMWPAFWTLPASGASLPEFDIMEKWLPNSIVHFVVHYGPTSELTTALELPSFADKFHAFAMDWEPHSIKWYVDGVLEATYVISLSSPEYLLATLSVAGFSPPNALVPFPQSLKIKSIEVWQHPGVGNLVTAP